MGYAAVAAKALLSPAAIVFVGTGVASTLIAQALVNSGAGGAWTALPAFFNYLGMAACALLKDPPALRVPRPPAAGAAARSRSAVCALTVNRFVAAVVMLDCIGYTLSIYALALAGSSLFQVLYSSVVVWAALGSWATRGSQLSLQQCAGIAVVLLGLAASSIVERGAGGVAATGAPPAVLLGMALSVACAMTYGSVYVLAEEVIALDDVPGPRAIAGRVGLSIATLLGAYIAIAVVPRADHILASMRDAGGAFSTVPAAAAAYALLAACSTAHSVSYYELVGVHGAVSTGLFSALRAVGVAVGSALLFCESGDAAGGDSGHAAHRAASQCMTPSRVACGALVVIGVLAYSASPKPSSRVAQPATTAGGSGGSNADGVTGSAPALDGGAEHSAKQVDA